MPSGLTSWPALGATRVDLGQRVDEEQHSLSLPGGARGHSEVFQLLRQLPGVALGRIHHDQLAGLDLQFLRE
jgi:hypothetical protein